MTVPSGKDPASLVAMRLTEDPGGWLLRWRASGGASVGLAWSGSLDALSEWAMANGFTGVEVRPTGRGGSPRDA